MGSKITKVFVNIYPGGVDKWALHKDQAEADAWAQPTRVACVEAEIKWSGKENNYVNSRTN